MAQHDEFVIRYRMEGSGTGGQVPDVAHALYFLKKLAEGAVQRGQLHNSLKVVGYEIRNVEEMLPAKPRKGS